MAGAADEAPLLVFLFASPLVRERKDAAGNVRLGPSAQLDADVELTELHRMLTDCGKAIRLRKVAATAKHLEEATRRPVRAIHFLGHGGREGHLMLETSAGGTQETPSSHLSQLLQCQLVFAAACHSNKAAEAFAIAGVPHVVGTTKAVSDQTVRSFASVFYSCLLQNRLTVLASFDRALSTTRLETRECPFVLLGRGTDPTTVDALISGRTTAHKVAVFGDTADGAWVDETPPPPLSYFPAPPRSVFGRNVIVHNTLSALASASCVCLRAEDERRGLGLSTVASAACRFAHRRRIFPGGVLFVDLRKHVRAARRRMRDPAHAGWGASGAWGRPAVDADTGLRASPGQEDLDSGPSPEGSAASAARPTGLAAAAAKAAAEDADEPGCGLDADDLSPAPARPVWELLMRAARRAAAGTRLAASLAKHAVKTEADAVRAIRRCFPRALIVFDGLDSLPHATEAAFGDVAAAPARAVGPPVMAQDPEAHAVVARTGRPEEDDDDDGDDGGPAAPGAEAAGTAGGATSATPTARTTGPASSRSGSPGQLDPQAEGPDALSPPGRASNAAARSGRPQAPLQDSRSVGSVASDPEGSQGGPDLGDDPSESPAYAGHCRSHPPARAGLAGTPMAVRGNLQHGRTVSASCLLPLGEGTRASSERAESELRAPVSRMARASTQPVERQRSHAQAQPGTDTDARSLIGALLSSGGSPRVLYTTSGRPLAPRIEGGGSESVLHVSPLSPADSGMLFVHWLPFHHTHTSDLGLLTAQYKAESCHLGKAVAKYVAPVRACNGAPGALVRLAQLLARAPQRTLGAVLEAMSPEAVRKTVSMAMDMDVAIGGAFAPALGATASGTPLRPVGLAAEMFDVSDCDSTGSDGEAGHGIKSGPYLRATGSADSDPFFGPRQPSFDLEGFKTPRKEDARPTPHDGGDASSTLPWDARGSGSGAQSGFHPLSPTDSQQRRVAAAFGPPADQSIASEVFGDRHSGAEQDPSTDVDSEAAASRAHVPLEPAAVAAGAAVAAAAASAAAPAGPIGQDWTEAGLLRRAGQLLGPGHGLDWLGARHWIAMRLQDEVDPAAVDCVSRPCSWDKVLCSIRDQLGTSAPQGLAARDFTEGDAEFLMDVLARGGQPLGASQMVSFAQWSCVLWPWLADAMRILEGADGLWALSEAAPFHPFLDSASAEAMLVDALRLGVEGAFVVRLSSSSPCSVAVTYTTRAPGAGVLCMSKVLLSNVGGVWELPSAAGPPYRSISLQGLLNEVPDWQFVPRWEFLGGFVQEHSQAEGRYVFDPKERALALLARPRPALGYKSVV
ncbi:hypothetical protein FNF28_00672 [Cafeteria roenbergensis]|uniref:CHAT domain-containing protein n=1 Tax=Cafeteria roenbergensis TaxID=33653 RepID=A0A5A8E5W6_CAFRO|nr:hypothetical protein FNF28_00672 [Cafeteria roenbergensis]